MGCSRKRIGQERIQGGLDGGKVRRNKQRQMKTIFYGGKYVSKEI